MEIRKNVNCEPAKLLVSEENLDQLNSEFIRCTEQIELY